MISFGVEAHPQHDHIQKVFIPTYVIFFFSSFEQIIWFSFRVGGSGLPFAFARKGLEIEDH